MPKQRRPNVKRRRRPPKRRASTHQPTMDPKTFWEEERIMRMSFSDSFAFATLRYPLLLL
jgi:hypothetical protein